MRCHVRWACAVSLQCTGFLSALVIAAWKHSGLACNAPVLSLLTAKILYHRGHHARHARVLGRGRMTMDTSPVANSFSFLPAKPTGSPKSWHRCLFWCLVHRDCNYCLCIEWKTNGPETVHMLCCYIYIYRFRARSQRARLYSGRYGGYADMYVPYLM